MNGSYQPARQDIIQADNRGRDPRHIIFERIDSQFRCLPSVIGCHDEVMILCRVYSGYDVIRIASDAFFAYFADHLQPRLLLLHIISINMSHFGIGVDCVGQCIACGSPGGQEQSGWETFPQEIQLYTADKGAVMVGWPSIFRSLDWSAIRANMHLLIAVPNRHLYESCIQDEKLIDLLHLFDHYQIQQKTAMKECTIELHFARANPRLMTSLDSHEKTQAIQEFKELYEQEMSRLKVKIERGLRVQKNLEEKEHSAQDQKRIIETSLKERMQIHFKKREHLQLQKLKNYQRVEGQWRDKLKTIAIQVKERQKMSALNSNRLSNEALMFWQERQEQRKQAPPSKPQPRYFSYDHTANLHTEEPSHFLTETPIHNESALNDPQMNFPTIRQQSRVRGQHVCSKSVAMGRHKSELVHDHLLKSSQLWRQKEGRNLQKVMQKLSHIEQTRNRAKSRLASESQRIKRIRLQKDRSHEQRFFHLQSQQESKQERASTTFSFQHRSHREAIQRIYQSKAQNKRNQLYQNQFKERGHHFEQQLKKQRKGGYRKMVKDAVQAIKLQKLRTVPQLLNFNH